MAGRDARLGRSQAPGPYRGSSRRMTQCPEVMGRDGDLWGSNLISQPVAGAGELPMVYICVYTELWLSFGILEKRQATLPSTGYVLPTRLWCLKIQWPSPSSTTNRTLSSCVLSFLAPTPPGGYWWWSTVGAGTISG